jgi:hypothetical protein
MRIYTKLNSKTISLIIRLLWNYYPDSIQLQVLEMIIFPEARNKIMPLIKRDIRMGQIAVALKFPRTVTWASRSSLAVSCNAYLISLIITLICRLRWISYQA